MRVPVSWLREYAPIPEPYDALEVGRRLTLAGLEVEAVEQVGHDVHGVNEIRDTYEGDVRFSRAFGTEI